MKLIIAAAALALLAAPAYAQDKMDAQTFVTMAAMTDMYEIKSGEMAQQEAESAEVKEFGKQMVADHTKLSNAMKETIKKNDIDVELPTELDAKHKEMLDQLESADGEEFDKLYLKQNTDGHMKAVELFENYSKNGDNEHLKKAAMDGLPIIKKHLDHVKKLSNMDMKKSNQEKM